MDASKRPPPQDPRPLEPGDLAELLDARDAAFRSFRRMRRALGRSHPLVQELATAAAALDRATSADVQLDVEWAG